MSSSTIEVVGSFSHNKVLNLVVPEEYVGWGFEAMNSYLEKSFLGTAFTVQPKMFKSVLNNFWETAKYEDELGAITGWVLGSEKKIVITPDSYRKSSTSPKT